MPTVIDVANLAQVSVATVSRVLQNSNRVSDEKRIRVENAIRELGYKTDAGGSMSHSRRKTILIICGNSQDEFIDSIFEAANEMDYDVAVHYTAGHSVKFNTFMSKLIKHNVIVGVITYGLSESSKVAMEEIGQLIPVVQCCDDLELQNSFVVSGDDMLMAKDSILHLIEKGRSRIAFLGLGKMKHRFIYSEKRFTGYTQALNTAGIPLIGEYVAQCDYSMDSVEEAIDGFLSLSEKPDAIFCVRDHTAQQVVNALTRRQIRIPEDMAIMGCGSVETAERCWLPLSNVSYPYFEIAVEAVNMLHNRIVGKMALGRHIIIQHSITDRSTT